MGRYVSYKPQSKGGLGLLRIDNGAFTNGGGYPYPVPEPAPTPAPAPSNGEVITPLPYPPPAPTKVTGCPAGTYPLSVRAIDPVTGDIGHRTVCVPVRSPVPPPTIDCPSGTVPRRALSHDGINWQQWCEPVSQPVAPTTPISVVSEPPTPEAAPSWFEQEWIAGVKNKWLAVAVAAALLLWQSDQGGKRRA